MTPKIVLSIIFDTNFGPLNSSKIDLKNVKDSKNRKKSFNLFRCENTKKSLQKPYNHKIIDIMVREGFKNATFVTLGPDPPPSFHFLANVMNFLSKYWSKIPFWGYNFNLKIKFWDLKVPFIGGQKCALAKGGSISELG